MFLSDAEVNKIKEYVPQALGKVEHLIIAERENGTPVAFMGTENNRLEMFFYLLWKEARDWGNSFCGTAWRINGIREVTVNERNPQAVGFYEHMGFRTYKRTN